MKHIYLGILLITAWVKPALAQSVPSLETAKEDILGFWQLDSFRLNGSINNLGIFWNPESSFNYAGYYYFTENKLFIQDNSGWGFIVNRYVMTKGDSLYLNYPDDMSFVKIHLLERDRLVLRTEGPPDGNGYSYYLSKSKTSQSQIISDITGSYVEAYIDLYQGGSWSFNPDVKLVLNESTFELTWNGLTDSGTWTLNPDLSLHVLGQLNEYNGTFSSYGNLRLYNLNERDTYNFQLLTPMLQEKKQIEDSIRVADSLVAAEAFFAMQKEFYPDFVGEWENEKASWLIHNDGTLEFKQGRKTKKGTWEVIGLSRYDGEYTVKISLNDRDYLMYLRMEYDAQKKLLNGVMHLTGAYPNSKKFKTETYFRKEGD